YRPSIGPEAEVDDPPISWSSTAVQLRQQLAEIQDAIAKRRVRRGLVAVERAVRIDQVDVADPAAQALRQLERAARKRLAFARLAGAHRRAHMRVAGVVEDAEVRFPDLLHDAH